MNSFASLIPPHLFLWNLSKTHRVVLYVMILDHVMWVPSNQNQNWQFQLNHWNPIQMRIINAKMQDTSFESQKLHGSPLSAHWNIVHFHNLFLQILVRKAKVAIVLCSTAVIVTSISSLTRIFHTSVCFLAPTY